MNLADRIMANARITPIQPANRVRTVTKLDNGDLRVCLNSGQTFDIAKDDEMFQAFVVYSVLAEL